MGVGQLHVRLPPDSADGGKLTGVCQEAVGGPRNVREAVFFWRGMSCTWSSFSGCGLGLRRDRSQRQLRWQL